MTGASLASEELPAVSGLQLHIPLPSMQAHLVHYKMIGGIIGTLMSALFLFVIALMNLFILRGIYRAWRHVRGGGRYVEDDFDMLLADRGFLARFFRPLFRIITQAWHMYPLGFLFGLGFDTATEIGLLGIAAAQAYITDSTTEENRAKGLGMIGAAFGLSFEPSITAGGPHFPDNRSMSDSTRTSRFTG